MQGILWLLISLCIAALCVPIVRYFGPIAIRDYVIEESYDDDSGPTNVVYRILSPALLCGALTLLVDALYEIGGNPTPNYQWLPVFLYWIILAGIKIIHKRLRGLFVATYLIEAFLSVGISIIISNYVVDSFLHNGAGILDQSNFAFQLELAVFYVAVQAVVTLTMRAANKDKVPNNQNRPDMNKFSQRVDTSEKTLFMYEREYGKLLPERYTQDPLLRAFFFSVMAIEDFNRPKGFRSLERIAAAIGMAKTTGIMQQQSNRPLTDKESVLEASKSIEKIWDNFLRCFAKSSEGTGNKGSFHFSATWYQYDYERLAYTTDDCFSSLYGDYCGTRLLNAKEVYSDVRLFIERNSYGLHQDSVVAKGCLFPEELRWLSFPIAFWEDAYSIAVLQPEDAFEEGETLKKDLELPAKSDIEQTVAIAKEYGANIEKVMFVDGLIGTITCIASEAGLDELKSRGWIETEMVDIDEIDIDDEW